MTEHSRAELDLAKSAQDAARGHYARGARGALAAGQDAKYTVQPGDTYESIAKSVYGDAKHGADIFDASLTSGAVSSDRKMELPGGTVLTLPVVNTDGPSRAAADDVARETASNRPTGERPSTTSAPAAREGGVGDTSSAPARTASRPRSPSSRSRSSSSRRKR